MEIRFPGCIVIFLNSSFRLIPLLVFQPGTKVPKVEKLRFMQRFDMV